MPDTNGPFRQQADLSWAMSQGDAAMAVSLRHQATSEGIPGQGGQTLSSSSIKGKLGMSIVLLPEFPAADGACQLNKWQGLAIWLAGVSCQHASQYGRAWHPEWAFELVPPAGLSLEEVQQLFRARVGSKAPAGGTGPPGADA